MTLIAEGCCYWAEQYNGYHVTATSQLRRDVNKFLLDFVILFKRVNSNRLFTATVTQKSLENNKSLRWPF